MKLSDMQRFYTAIVEGARNGFGVFFPDLPGCTSFGKTVEDAAANAYTAAQAHGALSREYGDTIPDPRTPDAIPTERGVKEKARLLIPVELADAQRSVSGDSCRYECLEPPFAASAGQNGIDPHVVAITLHRSNQRRLRLTNQNYPS
jgi:predicted RNase H-like HicB family nuclease